MELDQGGELMHGELNLLFELFYGFAQCELLLLIAAETNACCKVICNRRFLSCLMPLFQSES